MAGYIKGTTADGETVRMRAAFTRAVTAITASPDPEQAFRDASGLGDVLRNMQGEIADFRAYLASSLLDANALSLAQLAGLLGVSKARADQLVRAGREKGNTVTDLGTDPLPPAIALAIITSDQGVLVERRKDRVPPWTFPGGEIQPGESPAAAVLRRVPEETGVQVVAEKLLGLRVHPKTGRLVTYMLVHPHSTDAELLDTEDLAEVKWVSVEETRELMPDMHTPVRTYLDSLATG